MGHGSGAKLHKDGEHSQAHWGKYNPNSPFHWGIWFNVVFHCKLHKKNIQNNHLQVLLGWHLK